MRSPRRNVLIIGGGFSGTVLATRLLRQPPAAPTRLMLVERREAIGRGVAYQAGPYPYLLNVPAERMSADRHDPGQFVRYAQQCCGTVNSGDFLPRSLYGEYLQSMLESARQAAPAGIHFERIQGEVHELERIDTEGPFLAGLRGQGRILAEEVVLAGGDPPPATPAFALGVEGHDAYVCDPFADGAFRTDTRTLLLIGTGLTMADAALTAVALNPQVHIHAVSRHGLLPAAQGGSAAELPAAMDLPSYLGCNTVSARRLLGAFRLLLREVGDRGGDWRDAVAVARRDIPHLWLQLPELERRRFLRHLRTRWDTCRHRLPPATAKQLARLRERGQLQIHAGQVQAVRAEGRYLRVHWRVRGGEQPATLLADRVINCSGTDRRLDRTRDSLLRNLLDSGLATADVLGLGLCTGECGALVDRDGHTARHLFYLGPMLRSRYWEATAVGELRLHAEGLAQRLARTGQVC